jgi:predicted nucleic acid-binding protein
MIGVDTGFFLALCQPRDSLHDRARAWATTVVEPLLVTEYVLWETVNALSQPIDRAKAHALLGFLRASNTYDIVPASSDLLEQGLQLHAKRPDKEWSLTDCITFVVLSGRGITRALAYDHHYEQAGFEALLRHDPLERQSP